MREVFENLIMEKMQLLITIMLAALVIVTVVSVIFCMMWVKAFNHRIVYIIIYDRVYKSVDIWEGKDWQPFDAIPVRSLINVMEVNVGLHSQLKAITNIWIAARVQSQCAIH